MGHRWSFERNSISSAPTVPAYYLQSLNLDGSEMTVNKVSFITAQSLSVSRVVSYPSLKVYQGLDAAADYTGKKLTQVGNTIEDYYLDGIQYLGNLTAGFGEWFFKSKQKPIYLDSANSSTAYMSSPAQTTAEDAQSKRQLQISIQPGTPQPQQINVPMQTSAMTTNAAPAAPSAVYTIIPVHVPQEALAMSFEYKMDGTAPDDFMTMGIGKANNYTMEAKYVDDGQWNGTPVIQVSDFCNQDIQLVFALNGSNGPPVGMLSVRNIHFYIPQRPRLDLAVTGVALTASWILSAVGWTLEATTDITQPNSWLGTGVAPADANYSHTLSFDVSQTNRAFFRLNIAPVLTPYQQWQQSKFGANAIDPAVAGDSANPAHDGIVNLLKFAFNLNPLASTSGGVPGSKVEFDSVTQRKYLTLTYAHRTGNSGLSYTVEVSDDQLTWDGSGSQVETVGSPTPTGDGVTEWVKTRLKAPVDSVAQGRKFIRVKVTRTH